MPHPVKLATDCIVSGYEFRCTCRMYPEQYDVFKDGQQVAYVRYRHGRFSVEVPDCSDDFVFEADLMDDDAGILLEEERQRYLEKAVLAIENRTEVDAKLRSAGFPALSAQLNAPA